MLSVSPSRFLSLCLCSDIKPLCTFCLHIYYCTIHLVIPSVSFINLHLLAVVWSGCCVVWLAGWLSCSAYPGLWYNQAIIDPGCRCPAYSTVPTQSNGNQASQVQQVCLLLPDGTRSMRSGVTAVRLKYDAG